MSGRSYSKIYIHTIWHIKSYAVEIKPEHREGLYANIATTLKEMECIPISINGTGNHVHVLMVLSKNYALKDIIARIKRTTSYWMKNLETYYSGFVWQSGYSAFSVSQSVVDTTRAYINNQEEHHKRMSFEQELKRFLDLYGVNYDPKYLFSYD